MSNSFDQTFRMRVDTDFLARLDTWRAAQQPNGGIPSRAEAVRILVKSAISGRSPMRVLVASAKARRELSDAEIDEIEAPLADALDRQTSKVTT